MITITLFIQKSMVISKFNKKVRKLYQMDGFPFSCEYPGQRDQVVDRPSYGYGHPDGLNPPAVGTIIGDENTQGQNGQVRQSEN